MAKEKFQKIEKIKALCKAIEKDPSLGIGKPERLKFLGGNIWSRRIDQERRLIYEVKSDSRVFILQARYHY